MTEFLYQGNLDTDRSRYNWEDTQNEGKNVKIEACIDLPRSQGRSQKVNK